MVLCEPLQTSLTNFSRGRTKKSHPLLLILLLALAKHCKTCPNQAQIVFYSAFSSCHGSCPQSSCHGSCFQQLLWKLLTAVVVEAIALPAAKTGEVQGTNGGVTVTGLAASVAGGLFMGLVFWSMGAISPRLYTVPFQQEPALGQWSLVLLGMIHCTGSDKALGRIGRLTGVYLCTHSCMHSMS